jgi:hypothetical protein
VVSVGSNFWSLLLVANTYLENILVWDDNKPQKTHKNPSIPVVFPGAFLPGKIFTDNLRLKKTSLEGRRVAFVKQNIVHHTPPQSKAVSDRFFRPAVHVKS